MDLNAVAAFVAVANEGTFSGGARAIGIPKGSISRKISGLEETLGVRLFHRTTRKVTLTQIGQRYYQKCRRAMDELDAAHQLIDDTAAAPKGVLRISAPAAFGEGVFAKWVATFLETYPETRVETLLSDNFLDLIEHRIDIAFRFGELQDSTLIARKLTTIRHILCASPAYLEKHGTPEGIEQLRQHVSIVHSASLGDNSWSLIGPDGQECTAFTIPRLAGRSMELVRNAALSGLGIALLPENLAKNALELGRLVRVLPGVTTPEQGFYALYPSSRQLSTNVKAFLEIVDVKELEGISAPQ
ncbi:LysR substrate-binding domain-containing protein [Pseudophaeobacter sp.]|uniref:LysR family transcriptional regulator n=1 Tax=Pseudophaeobacter sp. TaxID=1971739 RepID=UPI003298A5EA